jgi:hypothetical protein
MMSHADPEREVMPNAVLSRTGTVFGLILLAAAADVLRADTAALEPDELIRVAVRELVAMQEEDGAWPYEGVYRVRGEIPIGYRIGGTAIVAEALLHAAPKDEKAAKAIERGLSLILKELDHPLMKPSQANSYDVRVWGHCYALEFLCQLRAANRTGKQAEEIDRRISWLVKALLHEEHPKGGWNYATRARPASFVAAPVIQALLLARSQGEAVPEAVFDRSRETLEGGRLTSGTFMYSGTAPADKRKDDGGQLPGSIARSPICETTLVLLGTGSEAAIRASLDAFHKHWNELEKRRKQHGTHMPPYAIAPYYFYYGHRYAAQAIEMLPTVQRDKERARLLEQILKTRDQDGTWNDRVFNRSRNFGTAMIVLALLGERMPMPPSLKSAVRTVSRDASTIEAEGAGSSRTESAPTKAAQPKAAHTH